MRDLPDPGWAPAVGLIGSVLTGRPRGTILLVMRAMVLLLGIVASGSALVALLAGAGSRDAQIGAGVARILISAAMGLGAIGISLTGTGGPDVDGPGQLAASVFRITMRRVLFAAGIGPAGLAISWLAGDGSYVVFGTGLALLFMAVAGPTSKRIAQFQSEVSDAGSDLSVLDALQVPFR